jgi:hypothetical protein
MIDRLSRIISVFHEALRIDIGGTMLAFSHFDMQELVDEL